MASAPAFNIGDRVQERRKAPSIQNNRDFRNPKTRYNERGTSRPVFVARKKGTILSREIKENNAGKSYWHYKVQYDGTSRSEERTQGVLKLLEEEE